MKPSDIDGAGLMGAADRSKRLPGFTGFVFRQNTNVADEPAGEPKSQTATLSNAADRLRLLRSLRLRPQLGTSSAVGAVFACGDVDEQMRLSRDRAIFADAEIPKRSVRTAHSSRQEGRCSERATAKHNATGAERDRHVEKRTYCEHRTNVVRGSSTAAAGLSR